MISPSSASLQASESTQFNDPAAKSWAIQPDGLGTIRQQTGIYTAPQRIDEKEVVILIAKDANGDPIGEAIITLLPPLKVIPATVELVSEQQQVFSVEPPEPVTWGPHSEITYEGVYTAGTHIFFTSRTVVVTARSKTNSKRFAHATVTLQDTPFKRRAVGVYLVLLGAILIFTAVSLWGSLCTAVKTSSVLVSPPIATLHPGDKLSLTASTPGTADASRSTFTWSKSEKRHNAQTDTGKLDEANGVYEAPASLLEFERVVITASQKEEPSKFGSSVVILSKESKLHVLPSAVTVHASQVVPFTALSEPARDVKIEWSVRPVIGQISADGIYQAPDAISESQTLTILAQSAIDQQIQAGAHVTLFASAEACSPRKKNILIFVLVMGALGSMLHAATSFGAFVGNQQFAPSWCWWYFFRPCLGSGLALIVFFVVGSGYMLGENVDNLFRVATIAGLVGLFSDQATLKLKELIETILATKSSDQRSDKLRAKTSRPEITSVTPSTIVHGTSPAPQLEIGGKNFFTGCKVNVNDAPRTTSSFAVTKLTISLTSADIAAAGTLKLKVVNPNGDTSNEVTISVT